MRAAVLEGLGSGARLWVREVRRPRPGSGQVLVAVRAAAMDLTAGALAADASLADTARRLLLTGRTPWIPGRAIAGEVAAIGPEVADFEPGDAVFALLDHPGRGGAAEYAVVRDAVTAPKPDALSFEEAAALAADGLAAFQALHDLADLRARQHIAIHGAATGTGCFAVQLAHLHGAQVTAAAGPAQQDLLRRLGADRAVDDTRQDFTTLEPLFQTSRRRNDRGDGGGRGGIDGGGGGIGGGGGGIGGGGEMRNPASPAFSNNGPAHGSKDFDGGVGAGGDCDDEGIYDAIFDASGELLLADCEPALVPGGAFVTVRSGPAMFVAMLRAGMAGMINRQTAPRVGQVAPRADREDLIALARLVQGGRLRPILGAVVLLGGSGSTLAELRRQDVSGSVVLRVE